MLVAMLEPIFSVTAGFIACKICASFLKSSLNLLAAAMYSCAVLDVKTPLSSLTLLRNFALSKTCTALASMVALLKSSLSIWISICALSCCGRALVIASILLCLSPCPLAKSKRLFSAFCSVFARSRKRSLSASLIVSFILA